MQNSELDIEIYLRCPKCDHQRAETIGRLTDPNAWVSRGFFTCTSCGRRVDIDREELEREIERRLDLFKKAL